MWYRFVVLVVAGALLFSIIFWQPEESVIVSLPDFQAKSMNGEQVNQQVLHKGGFVHFFRSSCGYCLLEHDGWVEFKKRHPDVVVVAVLHKETLAEAEKFFLHHKNPYDFVIDDQDNRLWLALGAKSTPETFIINQLGEVVDHIGYMKPSDFDQLSRIAGSVSEDALGPI